jgi:hypothetical protein
LKTLHRVGPHQSASSEQLDTRPND